MIFNREWIEAEGSRILVLKDNEYDKLKLVEEADAVILICSNESLTEFMIDKIRKDEKEEVYLKPLFIYSKDQKYTRTNNYLTDGDIYNLNVDLPPFYEMIGDVKERMAKLEPVKSLNFESFLINKMLRYVYSREIKSFSPVLNRKAKLGYSYPLISKHFSATDEKNVLDVLKIAEDEGYIIGDHFESIYLCNHCYNGFLFYREVCPKCDSTDLKEEDLIHHFPCAYVGPMADFTDPLNRSQMSCPKCNKDLKHIGVDYDKPSVIYTCNSCSHLFQEVQIKAKCCECQKDSEVEHLLHRTIKKYQVTSKGYYIAQNGISSTQKDLSSIPGTVSMDTFKVMLQYEIERMKVAEIESNLGYIHINNAMDLFVKIGTDSKLIILADLVKILRSGIRNSDVIAFENTTTLLFSLTESVNEEAVKKVKKISILIRKLIRDNYNGFQSDIEYRVHPINKTISYLEQLKEITAKVKEITNNKEKKK